MAAFAGIAFVKGTVVTVDGKTGTGTIVAVGADAAGVTNGYYVVAFEDGNQTAHHSNITVKSAVVVTLLDDESNTIGVYGFDNAGEAQAFVTGIEREPGFSLLTPEMHVVHFHSAADALASIPSEWGFDPELGD